MIAPVQKDEDLLEDFREADNVTGAIHVWWLGQSGFLLKWNGYGLLLDPYLSDAITRERRGTDHPVNRISERAIDPLYLTGIDVVACTSADPDRLDAETILPLRAANPTLKLVVPAGILEETDDILGSASPPVVSLNAGTYATCGSFDFHGITAATPKIRRDDRGNSKDLGFMILFGPFAIFHSGQTVWHNHLVKEVRRWPVNLAFLPIDGTDDPDESRESMNGFEAAAFAKAASASLAVPCHYDLFDVDNPDPGEFTDCCRRLGQRCRLLKIGQRLTMGPVTDPSAGKAPASEPFKADWGLGY